MTCKNCIEAFCTNRCDLIVRECHLTSKIQLSECGMVWRVKRGQLNRLMPYDNKGTLYIDLYTDGGQKRLAELMLKAFDRQGEGRIEYRDDNPKNCSIRNLKWKT